MTPAKTAWMASHVRRWHRNPHLGNTVDPLLGHSGRVALLLGLLWSKTRKEALWGAIVHDLGESAVGDVCGAAKRANGDLASVLDGIEAKHIEALGIVCKITLAERERIKFCDKLDAYWWAELHRPDILASDDWSEALQWLRTAQIRLGVDAI